MRLCRSGEWHTITIDDTFPTIGRDFLAYLKAARRSLWGPLIEKAAAKLWGSYEALAGGNFAEAFNMLTGFPVERISIAALKVPKMRAVPPGAAAHPADQVEGFERYVQHWHEEHPEGEEGGLQDLYGKLVSFRCDGFAIGASTQIQPDDALYAEARSKGIQCAHAYGVLDVRYVSFNEEEVALVKLRNPNGVGLWTGSWSRGDTTHWTYEMKQELEPDNEDQGESYTKKLY